MRMLYTESVDFSFLNPDWGVKCKQAEQMFKNWKKNIENAKLE